MTDTTFAAWEEQERNRRRLAESVRPANKAALFDALDRAGIVRVIVEFDGAGDSGQIESIAAAGDAGPADLPPVAIEIAAPADDGTEIRRTKHTIHDAIENLAYDFLEETHGGWEDNEGAFGEFTFDVKDRTITLAYNERHLESDYSELVF